MTNKRKAEKVFYMCGTDWVWEPNVRLFRSLSALRRAHKDLSVCGITRVVLTECRVLRRKKRRDRT